MEIIEIDKSQLIFVLEPQDMTIYMIEADSDIAFLKDGFTRMVNDFGVSPHFLSGVLVQIFNSKNGGCEMFVTKIPESSGLLDDGSSPAANHYIYMFNKMHDLISACSMLSSKGKENSLAYVDTQHNYYFLVLENENPYLGEFNSKRCKENILEHISEYCKLISDNAIETLSPLV